MDKNIDIVFCLDKTGSMGPAIQKVKANLEDFYQKLSAAGQQIGSIYKIRMRIIGFGDFTFDGKNALVSSDFFNLPEEMEELYEFIDQFEGLGGGDLPENGYEALYEAFKSKWSHEKHDRQIIILVSDADAKEIGENSDEDFYPEDMPDLETLENIWLSTDPYYRFVKNKLLMIYAPEQSNYKDITWDRVRFYPTRFEDENELSFNFFDDLTGLYVKGE